MGKRSLPEGGDLFVSGLAAKRGVNTHYAFHGVSENTYHIL